MKRTLKITIEENNNKNEIVINNEEEINIIKELIHEILKPIQMDIEKEKQIEEIINYHIVETSDFDKIFTQILTEIKNIK